MSEKLSAAELSRRLKISKSAISKAKSTGRLEPTLDASGREAFDFEEAQLVLGVSTSQLANSPTSKRRKQATGPSYREAIEAAKLRQMKARAELDEIKLELMRGEAFRGEDIKSLLGAIIVRTRTALLALARGVAVMPIDWSNVQERIRVIDERIRLSLQELSEFDIDVLKQTAKVAAIASIEKEGKPEKSGNPRLLEELERQGVRLVEKKA
jgi:transcriptional regulator with XRE-family HTH domain